MTVRDAASELGARLRGRLERHVHLAAHTTYRVGGPADIYVEISAVEDLVAVSEFVREHDDTAVLPLGRGSNLVVSDHGFRGVVVHLADELGAIEVRDGEVHAGAATPLPQLANWAARRGLTGVEFAVGVPGSVGGGVRMNAGAHHQELGSVVRAADVFDLRTGDLATVGAAACAFGYRRSALTDDQIVTGATLALAGSDPDRIRKTMTEFRDHRARTQPGVAQNAGSVFKNPPDDFAARLVEAAGLKGFRRGGAQVSEKHSNFFIADAGASAQDVFDLVHAVARRVHDEFGVRLEPEIRFVGDFESPNDSGSGR